MSREAWKPSKKVIPSGLSRHSLLRAPTDLAEWLEMDEDVQFEIEPVGLDIRSANV
jgi:hypothetical protein